MSTYDKTYKETLIKGLKKEVKQIMEEAVTRKFVHEGSASITSLCAAVESCVSHGLKRRALGLFKSSSTTALLHKVAKSFQPAADIVQLVFETESCDPNKRSSSGSESASKIGVKPPLQKRNSQAGTKYLWIRYALVQKELAKIIDYIVKNSSKYYEKYALVSDADYGTILSSLLVGPCALDFSKLRTVEHLWSDPPADELVQRHRISSAPSKPSPPIFKRPALHYKGSTGFHSEDTQRSKDYVESLHQNNKSTLLYGKNNVLVLLKDIPEPVAGYLSLHQCGELLNLKWTPNHLMNSSSNEAPTFEKSLYWDYALNLVVHEIVYVHCHQDQDRDWIVLVGQDGVQRPPIHFPRGGHLLAFLSCLENGLLPHGILDPPLRSQQGKGKVFPKLRRKGSKFNHANEESTTIDEGVICSDTADFVFRIVFSNFNREFPQIEEILEDNLWKSLSSTKSMPPATPRSTPLHSISTTSSTSSSKSLDQQIFFQELSEPIHVVCQTMKRQIISRAFYGWLAHCRHLRTVRTHLVGLVQQEILKHDSSAEPEVLTESKWKELRESESFDMMDLYKIVYFGGMSHSLRRQVWPILLAGNTEAENVDELRREYENQMSEWLVLEAIVQQRDKETMAANMAKLSSESVPGEQRSPGPGTVHVHGSNEVFEDDDFSEDNVKENRNEEKPKNSILNSEPCSPILVRNNKSSEDVFSAEDKCEKYVPNDKSNGYSSPRHLSVSSDDSPRSSRGGLYSSQLIEVFGLNLHRIDKDVKRCDRNYWYFTESNLDKLRNLMCTYVWEHMEIGYVQGMCDLAAPLLVIMDDEAVAYGCFRCLMRRMAANFPTGGDAMDANFANMRSLLQVLDNDLFSLIRQNGDYTHFYFCYRWFLLDFKREFCYDDVFRVWETIWAARQVASTDFVLFVALALLSYYREIILSNSMDFTDIIKFFNEMAEHHDVNVILRIARNLVLELQTLIENK